MHASKCVEKENSLGVYPLGVIGYDLVKKVDCC